MRRASVADVVTRPVTTVSEATPSQRIVATPTEHGVIAVPVLDGACLVKAVVTDADPSRMAIDLEGPGPCRSVQVEDGRYPAPSHFW